MFVLLTFCLAILLLQISNFEAIYIHYKNKYLKMIVYFNFNWFYKIDLILIDLIYFILIVAENTFFLIIQKNECIKTNYLNLKKNNFSTRFHLIRKNIGEFCNTQENLLLNKMLKQCILLKSIILGLWRINHLKIYLHQLFNRSPKISRIITCWFPG